MNKSLLIFTHIPKTAGTSVKKSVLFPTVESKDGSILTFYGVRHLWAHRNRSTTLLTGHLPYGYHHLLRRHALYITFLREPVDQAISYYYYVLQCGERNPGHPGQYVGHPDLEAARRLGLEGFYADPRNQNMQTRYTAGWWWKAAMQYVPMVVPRQKMLQAGKSHLSNRYWFVGLFEDIEASQDRLARQLNGVDLKRQDTSRKTRIRPRLSDVSEETKMKLRMYNSLDIELYEFARMVYQRQCEEEQQSH